MLTPRQKAVLDFIREREAAGARCPTTREIAAAVGLKARSGVSMMIQKLRDRGLVRHTPGWHRDIRVLSP